MKTDYSNKHCIDAVRGLKNILESILYSIFRCLALVFLILMMCFFLFLVLVLFVQIFDSASEGMRPDEPGVKKELARPGRAPKSLPLKKIEREESVDKLRWRGRLRKVRD
jgi:hypothetical protein